MAVSFTTSVPPVNEPALAPAGGISHKDIRRAAVSEWSRFGALVVCSRGSLSYLLLSKYVK